MEKLSLKRFGRAVTFKRNMSNSQRLAFAIIEHLSAQLKSGAVVGDSAESLEGNLMDLYFRFSFDNLGAGNKSEARRKPSKSYGLLKLRDKVSVKSGWHRVKICLNESICNKL